MIRVFIDGAEGTTGLRIFDRLSARTDLELIRLEESRRKDSAARREAHAAADISFLCLPDEAAKETIALVEGCNTRIIDASTAHRTAPGWCYGLPELSAGHANALQDACFVAVPGCHASGFIALCYPLIQAGLLSKEALLSCFSVTGYSGGGKKMIAQYEDKGRHTDYDSPRQYALGQSHKHLNEMRCVTGLRFEPHFSPIVADYYCGMAVSIPLHGRQLEKRMTRADLQVFYRDYYAQKPLLRVLDVNDAAQDGFLAANPLAGKDSMQLLIAGNDERITLLARYDNLGKGASGAAIQCMNRMLGLDETLGLEIE